MEKTPYISIIVPTYERPQQLNLCLQSLSELHYPRESFEIVVVNDGGEELKITKAFERKVNLTVITQPHAGPAAARNRGAARAAGDFLAFTDDDCQPHRNWLQAFARQFASAPNSLLGGYTINMLSENPYSNASQLIVDYLYSYHNQIPEAATFFTSNNMAVAKSAFRAVGGFDFSFPLAAGEDREFCERWLAEGGKMIYVPEARVSHAHALTLRRFWLQQFNYGRGILHLRRSRVRCAQPFSNFEPISFYSNLLLYPLQQRKAGRKRFTFALFALSQAANAAGLLYERFSKG